MSVLMSDDFILDAEQYDEFKMWQGLIGPYYYPSVDDAGNLSWTNNGGLSNPATVNIQGRGLTIVGIVEDPSDLPETADDYVTYLVGDEPPYHGYIYDEGTWVDLGLIGKGDKGDKGDPGVGVPTGGTTGQVLKKASSTNYDVEWANESGTVLSVDGKTGNVTVLPTGGTSGQVLSKASGTDYDVEWADASGGDVQTVNNVQPDANGNVQITADDIGTDATGISVQDAIDDTVHVGTSAPTDPTTKIWLDTDEPGMSAVSSVNGATGTVVLDADDVGAMHWDLLWTNASNMSTFAAQTIAIDLSDYDSVILYYRMANTTANHGVLSTIYPVSAGDCAIFGGYNSNTTGMRPFVISQTGLAFSNGTYGGNGNNDILIPYSIYGIKGVVAS